MTGVEQQTYVAQILGDTDNDKWQEATHILPALNSAQEEFVMKILAFSGQNKKIFNVLTELQTTTTQSVSTTGYALSGLDTTAAFARNGLITASATLDSVTRWCQIMDVSELNMQRNRYDQGNDERPLCYIYGEKFYIKVSTGSYPVSTVIYYIREPKTLVASGASGYQTATCELNNMYHRLIAEIAAANCWRMLGDESSMVKYDRIMARIEPRIQSIAMSGMVQEVKE